MEFTKAKGKLFAIGAVVTALGGLGTALLIGWFFEGGRLPIILFGAPLLLLVGLGVVAYALIPFRLRVDEHGITTRHAPEGLNTSVPWPHIAALTIERKPGDKEDRAPYIVLWPTREANLGTDPSFDRNGHPAYLLGQIDEIKEPEERIRSVLAHYAGPRFTQRQDGVQERYWTDPRSGQEMVTFSPTGNDGRPVPQAPRPGRAPQPPYGQGHPQQYGQGQPQQQVPYPPYGQGYPRQQPQQPPYGQGHPRQQPPQGHPQQYGQPHPQWHNRGY
ncbi:hypothetical protein HDA32_005734 [Spinactinospora alkalitolerans]|uniref:Uncharacterized protein n=1 Tax=Spinactinospora alkalitolerans TaxID=687207 RepID=A0A852U924_9ACTN|nr:hypothetical protein [Spinactinospora alkalitolerans]NYE50614.1 hypothetical protein [Spinactinospora alkalitolerans]